MTGGVIAAAIVIEILAVPLPPAFVAVTVYEVAPCAEDGVPEIVQVDVLKESPAGMPGEIEQLTIAPPVFEGVWLAIAVPAVNENGDPP